MPDTTEATARAVKRRKLKVYTANWDGRNDVLMACHSMREFLAITRAGRAYSHECCSESDAAVALAMPGTIFTRPIAAARDVPWTENGRAHPAARPRPDAATD